MHSILHFQHLIMYHRRHNRDRLMSFLQTVSASEEQILHFVSRNTKTRPIDDYITLLIKSLLHVDNLFSALNNVPKLYNPFCRILAQESFFSIPGARLDLYIWPLFLSSITSIHAPIKNCFTGIHRHRALIINFKVASLIRKGDHGLEVYT